MTALRLVQHRNRCALAWGDRVVVSVGSPEIVSRGASPRGVSEGSSWRFDGERRAFLTSTTLAWRSTLGVELNDDRFELSFDTLYLGDWEVMDETLPVQVAAKAGKMLWRDGRLHRFPNASPSWLIDSWTPRVGRIALSEQLELGLDGSDDFAALGMEQNGDGIVLRFYASHAGNRPSMVHAIDSALRRDWTPRSEGDRVRAKVTLRVGDDLGPMLHWWRYPGGCRAAWVMTDHADYDDPERLRAVFYGDDGAMGIAGSGLTCTKTIFVRTAEGFPGKDLGDREMASLLGRLHEDGIEVGPHTTSSEETDRPATLRELDALAPFRPRVWIDHGPHNRQNLTREGSRPESRFYILDELLRRGYRYGWAYLDIVSNPPDGNLNLFTGAPRPMAALAEVRARLSELGWHRASWMRAGYACLEAFETLWGSNARSRPKFIVRYLTNRQGPPLSIGTRAWRALRNALTLLGELVDVPGLVRRARGAASWSRPAPVLFPDPFWRQSADVGTESMWSFTSQRVNDVLRLYAPENIDRLIEEQGLHIGHTYLACDHPYLTGTPWTADDSGVHIHPEWAAHLRHIRKRVDEGKLWAPTMSALGDHMRLLSNVSIRALGAGRFRVDNGSERSIESLTLKFHGSESCSLYLDGEPTTLVLDEDGSGWLSLRLPGRGRRELELRATDKLPLKDEVPA